MALLETKEVDYYYQDGDQRRYILKETSVAFEKGKFYAILGQSGSGKTTFLSLISALDTPKSGAVFFNGEDIQKIGHEKYRRDDISIIFQSYNLIPYLSAVENVLVPMSITKEKADRLVNQLSGGEQQRVAIARALATNVDIILADEPTGNLDEEMEQEIIDIFKDLAHMHNKCVIVVTHANEIAQQADEVLYLRKGVLNKDE